MMGSCVGQRWWHLVRWAVLQLLMRALCMVPLLTHHNLSVRCSAAKALGAMGGAAAAHVDAVVSLLTDDNPAVRYAAAEALREQFMSAGTRQLLQMWNACAVQFDWIQMNYMKCVRTQLVDEGGQSTDATAIRLFRWRRLRSCST